jgi:hypothetical protein
MLLLEGSDEAELGYGVEVEERGEEITSLEESLLIKSAAKK